MVQIGESPYVGFWIGFPTLPGGGAAVWDTSEWDSGLWGSDVSWVLVDDRFVSARISPSRYSRRTGSTEPGSMTLVLDNSDGQLSPGNRRGSYVVNGVSQVVAGLPVRASLSATGETDGLFYGYVRSWTEGYSAAVDAVVVTLQCIDDLGRLGEFDGLEQASQGAGEPMGPRMHRILDNAGFAGGRDIHVGLTTMQPTTLAANALAELQATAASEGGSFWMNGDGTFVGRQSYHWGNVVAQGVYSDQDPAPQSVEFAGTGAVTTPDAASLDLTGDFDIRLRLVELGDHLGVNCLASKWQASGNQRSWAFSYELGLLTLRWSPDGSTVLEAQATVAQYSSGDITRWWRATLDVDNGVGGWTVRFYQSRDDGRTWLQLGDAVTDTGTTSIFSSTANVRIGELDGGDRLDDRWQVTTLQLRNGIDGQLVAGPDFRIDPADTTSTSIVDLLGLTWTLGTGCTIVGRATLPFHDIKVSYDVETLINLAAYARAGGVAQVATDEVSRAMPHGTRTHKRTDLICESDAQVLGLAQRTVARFARPKQRVESITFRPDLNVGHPLKWRLWQVGIGTKIGISFAPPNSDRIVDDLEVDGVEHDIAADPPRWLLTWFTSDSDNFAPPFWDSELWDGAQWAY